MQGGLIIYKYLIKNYSRLKAIVIGRFGHCNVKNNEQL